jgi:hypothetical protein
MMMPGRHLAFWFLLVGALAPAAGMSVAQADVSISVAPSLVELSATPGGTGDLDLRVSNEGTDTFDVAASIETYKDGTGDRSAVSWLSLTPTTFSLAAGQQQTIHVHVSVPAGIASGGRYGVAAFRTAAPNAAGSQVGVSGQLGVPLMIDVQAAEPLDRTADVDRLLPVLEPDGQLGFWAELRNNGNIHVTSHGGSVALMTAEGQPVGQLAVPESTAILPLSHEALMTDGSLKFEDGARYRARTSVGYGGDAPATADVAFTARADLALIDLAATESPDHGPSFQVGMHNQGELALMPGLRLAIRDAAGATVQSMSPPRPPLLLPGESSRIETQLPRRLPSGEYVLSAHAQYGSATVDRELPFRIGPPPAEGTPSVNVAQPERQVAQTPAVVSAPAENSQPSSSSLVLGLLVLLGIAGALGSLVWLPALAPLRRRLRRAARSFADPGAE